VWSSCLGQLRTIEHTSPLPQPSTRSRRRPSRPTVTQATIAPDVRSSGLFARRRRVYVRAGQSTYAPRNARAREEIACVCMELKARNRSQRPDGHGGEEVRTGAHLRKRSCPTPRLTCSQMHKGERRDVERRSGRCAPGRTGHRTRGRDPKRRLHLRRGSAAGRGARSSTRDGSAMAKTGTRTEIDAACEMTRTFRFKRRSCCGSTKSSPFHHRHSGTEWSTDVEGP